MKILAIAGSLRSGSYNKMLLNVAIKMIPHDIDVEIFDISVLKPLNQDFEFPQPKEVLSFKRSIREADAILIAAPEYNYGIPGVLKNAIDWASTPPEDNAWDSKLVAIMGASISGFGTLRSQLQLRQVLFSVNATTFNRPEIYISFAHKKFSPDGELQDEHDKEKVKDLILELIKKINSYQT